MVVEEVVEGEAVRAPVAAEVEEDVAVRVAGRLQSRGHVSLGLCRCRVDVRGGVGAGCK